MLIYQRSFSRPIFGFLHSGSTSRKLPQGEWFSRCQPAAAAQSCSLAALLAAWAGTDISHSSGGTDREPRAGVSWHIFLRLEMRFWWCIHDSIGVRMCFALTLFKEHVFVSGIFGLCSSCLWWCIGLRVYSTGLATYWWIAFCCELIRFLGQVFFVPASLLQPDFYIMSEGKMLSIAVSKPILDCYSYFQTQRG